MVNRTGMKRSTYLLAVAAFFVATPAPASADNELKTNYCIQEGMEEKATAFIAQPGFGVPLDGALQFTNIDIKKDEVVFSLVSSAAENRGATVAKIVVRPAVEAKASETTSKSFVVRPEILADSPAVTAAVSTAVASIVAVDDGDFYQRCGTPPGAQTGALTGWNLYTRGAVLVGLLALAAVAGRIGRSRKDPA
jgi:hypothetical protein